MNAQQACDYVKKGTFKILTWSIGLLFAAASGIQAFTVNLVLDTTNQMHELETRIIKIESNRFTTNDALILKDKLSDIQSDIAQIPKEVPPKWFKEMVYDNKRKLEQLEHEHRGVVIK